MKKFIIGILAPVHDNDIDPFDNSIRCGINYPKRVKEVGCIPMGLMFPEDKFIEEEADLCDAFIITGGKDVTSTGINLVHYAVKHNKPLLGICLGMQTIAGYEWIINNLGDYATYEEIDNFYKTEYQDEFLDFIDNHDKVEPFDIKKIEGTKHDVFIDDENSNIYKIYKQKVISEPSLHKQAVKKELNFKKFKIVGKSPDNIIEILEYKGSNFIVGVQFHPELEEKNIKLFKALKDSIKK